MDPFLAYYLPPMLFITIPNIAHPLPSELLSKASNLPIINTCREAWNNLISEREVMGQYDQDVAISIVLLYASDSMENLTHIVSKSWLKDWARWITAARGLQEFIPVSRLH